MPSLNKSGIVHQSASLMPAHQVTPLLRPEKHPNGTEEQWGGFIPGKGLPEDWRVLPYSWCTMSKAMSHSTLVFCGEMVWHVGINLTDALDWTLLVRGVWPGLEHVSFVRGEWGTPRAGPLWPSLGVHLKNKTNQIKCSVKSVAKSGGIRKNPDRPEMKIPDEQHFLLVDWAKGRVCAWLPLLSRLQGGWLIWSVGPAHVGAWVCGGPVPR